MTSLEIVEGAMEKIRQGWNQRALARDWDGGIVSFNSPQACSHCLMGALMCVAYPTAGAGDVMGADADLEKAERAVMLAIQTQQMATWNDRPQRTQTDVLGALEKAKYIISCSPDLQ